MNWSIDSLDSLKRFLIKQGTLYAPTGENLITYKKIDEDSVVNLSRNSDFSSREIWQPRTHYYLKYKDTKDFDLEYNQYDPKRMIVLGIRPCDIKGLSVFEKTFEKSDEFKKLRENTIIIGYLCENPGENCFCESMGLLPTSTEKMDLALYVSDGNYYISSQTDKGIEFFKDSPFTNIMCPPAPVYSSEQKKKISLEKVCEKIDSMTDKNWEAITFPCIQCRVCSYVCPTCHCFTITDETFKNNGGRAVVWDSCQSKHFTAEASGMNPRGSKTARVKNRILHKVKYYAKRHGETMCSGCGRCISNCPSALDLFGEIDKL